MQQSAESRSPRHPLSLAERHGGYLLACSVLAAALTVPQEEEPQKHVCWAQTWGREGAEAVVSASVCLWTHKCLFVSSVCGWVNMQPSDSSHGGSCHGNSVFQWSQLSLSPTIFILASFIFYFYGSYFHGPWTKYEVYFCLFVCTMDLVLRITFWFSALWRDLTCPHISHLF